MSQDQTPPVERSSRTIVFPDLAPLLEVSDAIERRDDAALLRIAVRRADQDTFFEQVRVCTECLSYPIDAQRSVFHHARLWMMPVVIKPAYLHALSAPDENAVAAVCSYCADWLGSQDVDIALLMGLPRYGDIAAMSPAGLRGVIEGLAHLDAPGRAVAAPVTVVETAYTEGIPILAFVAGIIKQPVSHPSLPDPTSARAVEAHRRIDGALSMMCESVSYDANESHSMRLPLPFGEALTSGLEMWVDSLLVCTQVRAWDIQHEETGRWALVLQIRVLDGTGRELIVRLPIVQWQLGKMGIERVLHRLAGVPLVTGLKENNVPADQAAAGKPPGKRH